MAIIYGYPFDINVQDADAWVGTNADNRKTKQFTALAVAKYLNKHGRISVSGQMVYRLSNSAYGGSGTISLPSGGGSNFSNITSLIVSVNDISPQYVVNFLNYLVGSQILISEQNDVNNFGHYNIVSYAVTANPDYYLMTLALVGSNGAAVVDEYYDMALFTLSDGSDKDYVFVQALPETTWTIQHDLDKFPSVSVVNNNNVLLYGETTYIDTNNLTINFSAGFSGKAYLN
jgi:hypothetical protein